MGDLELGLLVSKNILKTLVTAHKCAFLSSGSHLVMHSTPPEQTNILQTIYFFPFSGTFFKLGDMDIMRKMHLK